MPGGLSTTSRTPPVVGAATDESWPWSAIEKGLTTIFQTRGRNVTLKAVDVAVRFIRPDVALAHVTNELSGLVSPQGQTLPPHQELSIRVLVKDQGIWRITAFPNTLLQK